MIYTFLSLFNETFHFSGIKALWCSGEKGRAMVEKAGFDFASLCVMIFCFLCFYFLLLLFQQRHQSFRKRKFLERAYEGKSWNLQVCLSL